MTRNHTIQPCSKTVVCWEKADNSPEVPVRCSLLKIDASRVETFQRLDHMFITVWHITYAYHFRSLAPLSSFRRTEDSF